MPATVDKLRRRAAALRALRAFFDGQGFVEVDTPVAAYTVAPEPHLEAPVVELHAGGRTLRRFLQTSPELAMKRLLATGLERIYQVAPAFRDGDLTRLHRPEFRILEWYRRGEAVEQLMSDCEGLLRAVAAALGDAGGFAYQGRRVELSHPFARVSVDDAFRRHAGFSILDFPDAGALAAELRARGVHHTPTDSWDDLFHRVFLTTVEPALLASGQPLFLTDYPAPLAALARLSPRDPRVAERFELYVGGLELANAFGELTDAAEQRRRFARDRALRLAAGMADYPEDERFFAALATLPPSAGIALGVDRLFMLLLDATEIDEVAFIPWLES
jgi:lysyl-tRNA synthetase class 2